MQSSVDSSVDYEIRELCDGVDWSKEMEWDDENAVAGEIRDLCYDID